MAIATLALCFDNGEVFEKNVKIRKGLALKLINNANDIQAVKRMFGKFCREIATKVRGDDVTELHFQYYPDPSKHPSAGAPVI